MDDNQVKAQMSKVSFGALAKAQDALSQQSSDRKRKRGDDTSKSQEDKSSSKSKTKAVANETGGDRDASDDDSDSDAAPHARSSKHAPAVQSSKRMVSRKRNVVEVKKPVFRDPRFDSVTGPRPDEHVVSERYSFLNDYRASEISELRNTIKKTKNEDEKERLKKKLMSMESQQKARDYKDKLQEVAREHKKKEKELVKEGKKPFFLKKCMSNQPPSLPHILTVFCSRTKEDCFGRAFPEHEVEAARQGHRTPAQEGHCQGKEEYARHTTHYLMSVWRIHECTLVGLFRYPFAILYSCYSVISMHSCCFTPCVCDSHAAIKDLVKSRIEHWYIILGIRCSSTMPICALDSTGDCHESQRNKVHGVQAIA